MVTKVHKANQFNFTGQKKIFKLVQASLNIGHLCDSNSCPLGEAKSTAKAQQQKVTVHASMVPYADVDI